MEWAAVLIQAGIGGVGLLLFIQGVLQSRVTVNERLAEAEKRRVADLAAAEQRRKAERELLEQRIKAGDTRNAELRTDRDHWRGLALGTEARLDRVPNTLVAVAAASGAPIPSAAPVRSEAGT